MKIFLRQLDFFRWNLFTVAVVYQPAYIRRRNRCNHAPLLALENWRANARRGRIVTLRNLRPETSSLSG